MRDGKMRLGAIFQTGGQHIAAWRHPDAQADSGMDFAFYQHLVGVAECGKLDFVFIADTPGVRDWPVEILCRSAYTSLQIEPLTLMAALSAVTTHIGFIVTASTTYSLPYTVAREFAGFDLISGGRAAWNVVTSTQTSAARNYGLEKPASHAERYERATEFAAAVKGLWNSVKPGVFIGDKASGLIFDQQKIHPYRFEGKYFSVDGILNVPPSAQGRPVIVQAGASGPGRDLAASIAEVIFAISPDIEVSKEFYADIKARMRRFGRDPSGVRIMVGLIPVIGETREEAHAKLAELDALIHPDVALACLSDMLGGIDLSSYPIDGPFPDDLPGTNHSQTLFEQIAGVARQEGMTIRQIATRVSAGMSHLMLIGTAAEIADQMEHWFRQEACDGFLASALLLPCDLELFVERVVPELQRRGLFREDYEAGTLRGNLGLDIESAAVDTAEHSRSLSDTDPALADWRA